MLMMTVYVFYIELFHQDNLIIQFHLALGHKMALYFWKSIKLGGGMG